MQLVLIAVCEHPECSEELDTRQGARGMCQKHYARWAKDNLRNHTIVCQWCQKKAKVFSPKRKCCSAECASHLGRQHMRPKAGKPPPPKMTKICKAEGCREPINAENEYCGSDCRENSYEAKGRPKTDLRLALESGDNKAVLQAVRSTVTVDQNGCWLWPRLNDQGYATIGAKLPGRYYREYFVHRVVLEAVHEKPLGSQHGHHICAVRACVNPDHLQPVTHQQNNAEMLHRNAYKNYISQLRDGVTGLLSLISEARHDPSVLWDVECDPDKNPLLNVVDYR
jgi:hypothetical protein